LTSFSKTISSSVSESPITFFIAVAVSVTFVEALLTRPWSNARPSQREAFERDQSKPLSFFSGAFQSFGRAEISDAPT
jgi:hypothetical protein